MIPSLLTICSLPRGYWVLLTRCLITVFSFPNSPVLSKGILFIWGIKKGYPYFEKYPYAFRVIGILGFPKIVVPFLGPGPYYKGKPNFGGSIIEVPNFRKIPIKCRFFFLFFLSVRWTGLVKRSMQCLMYFPTGIFIFPASTYLVRIVYLFVGLHNSSFEMSRLTSTSICP